MNDCLHHVLRKSKEVHAEHVYVCGSCATLFVVEEKKTDPEPKQKEPMFDRRPPWGLRDRQA